jgi:isoquinoline 1-oxidoreductase beta subunit
MNTLSRADFITLASSMAGSLVLLTSGCNMSTPGGEHGENFSSSAWIVIHPDDTIVFFSNRTEMGQGVILGLPTLVAEELDVALDRIRYEVAQPDAKYFYPGEKSMSTGGSMSMRMSWHPLRQAAATARTMLIQAAAKNWNVSAASLRTDNGEVIDPASNRRATYGALATQAAALPVPQDVALKSPAKYKLIGKANVQRADIPSKVNGSTKYGIDVVVPGMKYVAIARSPVFGGTVKSFDANKAKQVTGVTDVVQVPTGVAVIANNTWAAFQGKLALTIEWDEGPNAYLNSPALFAEYERLARSGSGVRVGYTRGNVDSARGKTIEALYEGPFLAHATMEPMNATADVRDDACEIWAPTQAQSRCRTAAAKITGLPPEKIILHTTALGGGFGRRLQSDYVEEAVEVSKAIKAPVKVMWTREDDIQHDFYRPMAANSVRGILDPNLRLVSLETTAVAESIVKLYSHSNAVDYHPLFGIEDAAYEIPNLRINVVDKVSGVPVGSWRAPDANWNSFVLESFIDEAAHAAGKDPVEFRLAMLKQGSPATRCLQMAAERARWGTPRSRVHQGVAMMYWNGSTAALIADVSLANGRPKVHHVTVAVHCGTAVNPGIIVAQTRSAVNFGLSAALTGNITLQNGRVQQSNFNDYTVLLMADSPSIDVSTVPSEEPPTGMGELGVPGIAPAIANAIFAMTGKRVRRLPFNLENL